MLNVKAGLLLLIALGLGSVAAYMAHGWINQQGSAAAEVDATSSVDVYVAAREIPYGKTLNSTVLKKIAWPRDSVPKGAILASEKLDGKIVNQAMLPGELMMKARVVDKLAGNRLSAIVTPSKRAISVRVNDVAGVAGFLLPGNRVDVLATRMENRRAKTQALLQNIKVLAIDQKASPDKDEPAVVRAVTLEVELEEAGLLASATEEGTIQLVLRNPDDVATERSEPQFAAAEDESGSVKQSESRTAPKRIKRRRNVQIIRGTEVKNINFRS